MIILAIILLLSLWMNLYADTLTDVKARGFIRCGIHEALTGFSTIDKKGERIGFDIDFCRAISSAIFQSPDKVKYVPVNIKTRFLALSSGTVDVLSRNTTWSLDRDTGLGISFTAINFYDGQSFLVPKKFDIKQLSDLNGATICVMPGTTTELNLADYFSSRKIKYTPVVVESLHQAMVAYEQKRCDAFTTDRSALEVNIDLLKNPNDHEVLNEIISKEPLALAVASGDEKWRKIVTWVVWSTIQAEELEVDMRNVDSMKLSKNPKIMRLLGTTPLQGIDNLGLKPNFIYFVIAQVGNYGEIFKRNLKPLGLSRHLNHLWNNGGLMYSPPIR